MVLMVSWSTFMFKVFFRSVLEYHCVSSGIESGGHFMNFVVSLLPQVMDVEV